MKKLSLILFAGTWRAASAGPIKAFNALKALKGLNAGATKKDKINIKIYKT